jgi:hypothetical protein
MPLFPLNKEVAFPDAKVTFEGTEANKLLPSGVHLFQLIVEDGDKIASAPIQVRVVVHDRPVAVGRVSDPVITNEKFDLDGSASTPTGNIKNFRWTYLGKAPA